VLVLMTLGLFARYEPYVRADVDASVVFSLGA